MKNLQQENIKKMIKDAVRDNPDVPSRTLARMIYSQNIQIFKDLESVRSSIRWCRGKRGEESRLKFNKE